MGHWPLPPGAGCMRQWACAPARAQHQQAAGVLLEPAPRSKGVTADAGSASGGGGQAGASCSHPSRRGASAVCCVCTAACFAAGVTLAARLDASPSRSAPPRRRPAHVRARGRSVLHAAQDGDGQVERARHRTHGRPHPRARPRRRLRRGWQRSCRARSLSFLPHARRWCGSACCVLHTRVAAAATQRHARMPCTP